MYFYVIVLFLIRIVEAKPKIECGYKQCPQTRDGALNIHLVPHSHMDAGWIKTFDQYYFGANSSLTQANVQLIYHSVISELMHDRRRRFTFSEVGYFWRWWKDQRLSIRATFKAMVDDGRIEFAGGGWVQNDEATTDYLQIIDQYTWGLRKINDTVGPCGKPKAAWQIDTYGHSREQASLLAQMGYDGLFIGRVHFKDREAMLDEGRMEFMWRGSDTLGKVSDIMTHSLYNLYSAPEGFCFDILCGDEPIADDPKTTAYNADKRVLEFITKLERQAKYYDHDNILVPMGGDFTYQSAASWFMNMDKLIHHVNTHHANLSDVNIFYSSPSCYLKSIYLNGRKDKSIYTEKGDSMPYANNADTYWTGFYTTRPSLKYFIRRAFVFLQTLKQLSVITQTGDSYELHLLRNAVYLAFHHDTITGTSQSHVITDVVNKLSKAIDIGSKKASSLLTYLTPTWSGGARRTKNMPQLFQVCLELNISECKVPESQDSMLVLVYNPSSVKTYHYLRIPAVALHYSIKDYNEEDIEHQLIPLPSSVTSLPGRTSKAIQELCFEAENIPPLGFLAFYITPLRDPLEENKFERKSKTTPKTYSNDEKSPEISNEYLKVSVDPSTGLMDSIQHVDGLKIKISQNFFYYSQQKTQFHSGAYAFRPSTSRPIPVTEKAVFDTVRGTLVKEIRQTFSDWVSQTIRLYRGEEFVEVEWVIGPVPVGDDLGKEVVTIFQTNVTTNGVPTFYTDSNSRQMMKRSCWNQTSDGQLKKKAVQQCYFPVTSRICVNSQNTSLELCVLTDRSQGATSYENGEIELMVHRRLMTDDGFGLDDNLNEEAFGKGLVVRGKHRIIFGDFYLDGLSFAERASHEARRWKMEPWLFFSSSDKVNRRKWHAYRNKRYTAIRSHSLPRNIHIVTLEPWRQGAVLLRLENSLQTPNTNLKNKNQATESTASHITVELRKIFLHMNIKAVRETTLAANQWLDNARQMDWSTRYTYSGSDDVVINEDYVDYNEDKSNSDYHYYDDDQEFIKSRRPQPRSKLINKKRVQTKMEQHERKRRSVNLTVNMSDFVAKSIKNHNNNHKNSSENDSSTFDIESPKDFSHIITTTFSQDKVTSLIPTSTLTTIPKNVSNIENRLRTKKIGQGILDYLTRIRRKPTPEPIPINDQESDEYNKCIGRLLAETPRIIDKSKNGEIKKKSKRSSIPSEDGVDLTFKKLKPKQPYRKFKRPDDHLGVTEENIGEEESQTFFAKVLDQDEQTRRPRRGAEVDKANEKRSELPDDKDDGITKSIYEMYYKPQKPVRRYTERSRSNKTPERNRRTQMQSRGRFNEEDDEIQTTPVLSTKRKRGKIFEVGVEKTREYEDDYEIKAVDHKSQGMRKKTTTEDGLERNRGIRSYRHRKRVGRERDEGTPTTTPIPRTKKRKEYDYEEYEAPAEEDRDMERLLSEREEVRSEDGERKKRAIKQEKDNAIEEERASRSPKKIIEEPETRENQEFTITLRPMQIRTFVVWFER